MSARTLSARRWAPIGLASALLILALSVVGTTLVIAALPGRAGAARQGVEIAAAAGIVLGALLLAFPLTGARQGRGLGAGVLALLGSLVYLGTALPAFHRGLAGYPQATAQFVAVLAGIAVGGIALALPSPDDPVAPADAILRDGLVLVAGTILLAIGTGQLARPMLMPPKWQWISFLGLTVPGMLILVVARGRAKPANGAGAPSWLRALLVELMLVAGLAVMVYGSTTNLGGVNGFTQRPAGNASGLALWLGAAAFLVVVRGGAKHALERVRAQATRSVAERVSSLTGPVVELLYVAGAAAFVYGERAVITGTDPTSRTGGALPAAAGVVGAAVVLLIPMRLAVKRSARRAVDDVPTAWASER